MASSEIYWIAELKEQMRQMNAKNEKIETLEKELREVKNQQMDQITKLLAHLEKTNAAKCYAATLPSLDSSREIQLKNGHTYTPAIENFIRHGAAHCRRFFVSNETEVEPKNGFVGYPDNFFNDLIKYCYESDKPEEMIRYVVFQLPTDKLAPWPSPLVQLHGTDFGWVSEEQLEANGVPATLKELRQGDPSIEEEFVSEKVVHYTLQNKHNPQVLFRLRVWFEHGGAICYKQMTSFVIDRKV